MKMKTNVTFLTLPFKHDGVTPTNISAQIILFIFCLLFTRFIENIVPSYVYPHGQEITALTISVSFSEFWTILFKIPIHEWVVILNNYFGAGIREEMVYRYFLFKVIFIGILRMPFVMALFLSSAMFGLMHYSNIIDLHNPEDVRSRTVQVFTCFLIGLLYGYLYSYTNNIWFVIFLHGISNTLVGINELFSEYRVSRP